MIRFADGSIFRPRISPMVDTKKLVSSYNISEVIRAIGSSSNMNIIDSNGTTALAGSSSSSNSGSSSIAAFNSRSGLATNQSQVSSNTSSTSTKFSKRRGVGSTFLSGVASISQQIQPLQQIGRPGMLETN